MEIPKKKETVDERHKLKSKMKESHSTSEYRKYNNTIKKSMQEAKKWIKSTCSEIENNLMRINSIKAYRVGKDLTTER